MTMPSERTRAMVWAGGFLIDVARNRTLPLDLRRRAIVIARHFPTLEDVSFMASLMKSHWLGSMLAEPNEESLSQCGSHGPLSHATRLGWPNDPK